MVANVHLQIAPTSASEASLDEQAGLRLIEHLFHYYKLQLFRWTKQGTVSVIYALEHNTMDAGLWRRYV